MRRPSETIHTIKQPSRHLSYYQEHHILPSSSSSKMQSTLFVLSALFAAAYAGNVCVAGEYKASSNADSNNLMVFAAGSPCDDSWSTTLKQGVEDLCDNLPQDFTICDKDAKLVKIDSGPEAHPGCQIGLEIDGEEYEGETWKFNPDDGNAHNGPCDADCGLTTGVDGFLHFVGVPMCD
jgi:hypothetical protein